MRVVSKQLANTNASEDKRMDHMEMVEKLRQHANVTYEEAKAALESANWDMLDAMIELERRGKVRAGAAYETGSTRGAQYEKVNATASAKRENNGWKNFCASVCALFSKSCKNSFRVTRNDSELITVPLLVMVILMIVCFWILLPVLVVALFFNCRYSFVGPDFKDESVNRAMGKATDAAASIKETFASAADEGESK